MQHSELGTLSQRADDLPQCTPKVRSGSNCTHYRAAALLSALPQLAESIRAAKRFRIVPVD
jgi:hypothetical protein